ncbi:MAG: hypothetical protein EP330_22110 [Deltaproteobacteria bacterium]|nr:MAG: hypothetical protein EP330_22110 [Deltaproteobacteria bacterium]
MPQLGPFELSHPLDEGGLASVWAAVHLPTRLPVALKVLHPDLDDRVSSRALRDELRAMARLEHPHIVRVLDRGVVPPGLDPLPAGVPWMALEYAPHGSLLDLGKPMPWPQIRAWLLELLSALGHAHAHGILHRDVKPSNVLIDARGRAKLCDFGLASALEPDDASQEGGTPRYMAPEQFLSDAAMQGPWTDLYSVGCLAWRLVTGAPPFTNRGFDALKEAHLRYELPPLEPWTAIPEDLELWLHTLLAKDPRARFTTAPDAAWHLLDLGEAAIRPEFHDDLGDFLESESAEWDPEQALTELAGDPLGDPTPVPIGPSPPPFPPLAMPRRTPPPKRTAAGLPLWHMRPITLSGREGLKKKLWEELSEVHRHRRTRVLSLSGEAGVGKGELATWLVEQARESGAAGALRAVHNEVPGAHDGLLGMLRRHFRWTPGERAAVERALRRRGEEDGDRIEALWQWIDTGRSPVQLRHHLVVEHFGRLVAARPYVLVIEDAQWAADAITACHAMRAAGLPILVVLTVDERALRDRPVERHLLRELAPIEYRIEALTGETAKRFARSLPLPADVAEQLVERARGRPVFIHELIAEWVASGTLTAGPDGPVLASDALWNMPRDMADLWRRRVDHVLRGRPESDAIALGVAAALGRVVPWDEWHAACAYAGVPASSVLVEKLTDAGLVRRASGKDPAWSFTRASLRDALTERLGPAARDVHRACAQMLEAMGGAPMRVARHLLAARDYDQAVPALLEGARVSLSRGEYAAAAEVLDLARPHLRDDRTRLELRCIETSLAHRRGERERAGGMALELLESAEALGELRFRVEARSLLRITALASGDQSEALSWAEDAAELAEESGEEALVARTALGLGDILLRLGRTQEAERPLLRASIATSPHTAVLATLHLAELARSKGEYDDALQRVAEARDLAEAEESASARATSDLTEAEIKRYQGDLPGAEIAYARATRRMDALGEVGAHAARIGWGLARLLQGDLDGLIEVDEGLDHARTHGFPGSEAYALCARAVWAAQQPDAAVFKQELLGAVERIHELDYIEPDFAEVLESGARRMMDLGRPSRAQRLRDAAADLWKSLGKEERAEKAEDLIAPPPRRR